MTSPVAAPTASKPHDMVVLVHGMANFRHNRGTKVEQEQLLRSGLAPDFGFLGAYDDSGNYAFRSDVLKPSLAVRVIEALSKRYALRDAIALRRDSCLSALAALEREAQTRYGPAFNTRDYSVIQGGARWRLGLVFFRSGELGCAPHEWLLNVSDDRLEVLTRDVDTVGVLKYDQGARIPWGQPAGQLERAARIVCAEPLATGRSARTVRGVLRLFAG